MGSDTKPSDPIGVLVDDYMEHTFLRAGTVREEALRRLYPEESAAPLTIVLHELGQTMRDPLLERIERYPLEPAAYARSPGYLAPRYTRPIGKKKSPPTTKTRKQKLQRQARKIMRRHMK